MWTASDDALLAGFAAGDPDAATAFVRRFQARVFGLAVRILRDPAAAEDVAQETFTKAWRHGATYDARRGSVPTWLLTITRNLAIDVLRLRRPEPCDPMELIELPWHGQSPEEEALRSDDGDTVRRALRELPIEQGRAVLRATFFGATAAEVAAAEGIPLGTAKTRIRTGLIKMHAALAELGSAGS